MKKIVICLLCLFMVTGCSDNTKLDLNKISSDLDNLKTEEIDIHGIDTEAMGVFDELDYVYDYDFMDILGLEPELVSDYNVLYNYKKKQLLAIFKPVDGKKDEVKNQLDDFMTEEKAELKEMNELLVYVASSNNELVFNKIKESKVPVFGMMMEVSKEQIKDTLNIEQSDVSEFLMKMPMMIVQSNTYIIVKPADGKVEVVKNAIDDYMKKLETQWQTYLPEQYELVKNRKEAKIGSYLIYIVSNNNDLVFDTISKNKIAE